MSPESEILKLLEAMLEHPSLEEVAKEAGIDPERARELLKRLGSTLERRTRQAVLIIDGASKGNPGPAGAGVVLYDADGWELDAMSIPLGVRTNNEAEYLALIHGLKRARELGIEKVRVMSDSELLIRQMRGEYQIKDKKILKLVLEAGELCRSFSEVSFEKATRVKTRRADRLARTAANASKARAEER